MTEIEHTPLPWEEDQDGHFIWANSIGSCNLEMTKHMVAQIRGWGHLRYLGENKAVGIQKANQKLIVRAVNNHDALVEALDIAEHEICNLCKRLNPQHKNCTSCDGIDDIKEILAEAKGKS